jgi:hypothetical protein
MARVLKSHIPADYVSKKAPTSLEPVGVEKPEVVGL